MEKIATEKVRVAPDDAIKDPGKVRIGMVSPVFPVREIQAAGTENK